MQGKCDKPSGRKAGRTGKVHSDKGVLRPDAIPAGKDGELVGSPKKQTTFNLKKLITKR